jgi:hypothetical protein
MTLRRAPSFAIVAFAFTGACSLFVDTGDLEGEDPASDAAIPEPPDAMANGDAGGPDANDGASSTDDASAPSCDSLVVDTFDVGALGGGWTSVTGTAALDTSDFVSAPNALALTLMPDGGSSKAYLRKTFSRAKTVCCDLAFRAPSVTGADSHRLLRFVDSSGNYHVSVWARNGATEVQESLYSSTDGASFTRVAGEFSQSTAWRHLRLFAKLPAAPGLGSLEVTLDGVTVIRAQIGSTIVNVGFDEVRVGSDYSQGWATRVLHYDDVRCSAN